MPFEEIGTLLWQQFGASIDMLENAMNMCPEALWHDSQRDPWHDFWYITYHTLFYLDFYLSERPDGFAPPAPFTLSEFEATGYPERVYSLKELLVYLEHDREKCRAALDHFTSDRASQRFQAWRRNYSRLELHLYNMRHVQHHVGQLNWLLRQQLDAAPDWVSRAKETDIRSP